MYRIAYRCKCVPEQIARKVNNHDIYNLMGHWNIRFIPFRKEMVNKYDHVGSVNDKDYFISDQLFRNMYHSGFGWFVYRYRYKRRAEVVI